MKQTVILIIAFLSLFSLNACFEDGNDQTVQQNSFSLNVTGLLGSITIRNNTESPITYSSDGTYTLNTSLKESDTFNILITDQPPHQDCLISTTTGSFSEPATSITISCTNKATVAPFLNNKKIYLNPSSSSRIFLDGVTDSAEHTMHLMHDHLAAGLTELGADIACVSGSVSSTATVDEANVWGARIFIYFSINAGGGSGSESFYSGAPGEELASSIQTHMIDTIRSVDADWPDRGIKINSTWNILTLTTMPATAIYSGFCDSSNDSPVMVGDDYHVMATYGIIKGIYHYFDATKYPPLPPKSLSLTLQPGTQNILLSWETNDDDTSGDMDNIYYFIYSSNDEVNFSSQPISTSNTSYIFSGLPQGTHYFKLKTYHISAGSSYSSESVSITIP